MKRRQFILKSAGGLAIVLMPALILQSCKTKYDSSLALPQQLTFIWDVTTMIAIGNQYQQQFPDESNERKLVKLLMKDVPDKKDNSINMEEKVIEDYKRDKTVLLDGWILSETEARQCALFSITHSN